ncbi:MAG: TetR family transcriptional regulator C-terminal domain-containing protein [Rhizobium sp.]|nr:TetR family transcriptional regulator C-terminal domain-containing protein [Rhizobium sp.]
MGELGKFERKLPEERRRALIEATLACLAREGHAGLSIRKISQEAGISVGLINHHYASKDALVGHAYETLSLGLLANIRDKVEAAGIDPRARLSAYFRASLSAPVLERSTLRTWVVFWGLIDHSAIMTEVHDRTYAEYRRLLETLLAAVWEASGRPMPDLRLASIGLIAIHDGLWLEWCLNRQTFSSEEAIGLCEQWTDSMLATGASTGGSRQN